MKKVVALVVSGVLAISMLGCDSRTPEERAVDDVNKAIGYEGEYDDDIVCSRVQMNGDSIRVVSLEKVDGADFENSVDGELSEVLLDMDFALFDIYSKFDSVEYVDYTLKYNGNQLLYLKMDADTYKYLDDSEKSNLSSAISPFTSMAVYDDYKVDNVITAVYNAGSSYTASIKDCYGIPEGEQ